MSAHFITGTGTDIGKTWLVCALLRHWQAQGLAPTAYKPVQSGFDPVSPQTSDAGLLLTALGREINAAALDAMAPWRYTAPLSPDMAAALEGRRIPFDDLVDFTRRFAGEAVHAGQPMLIEGVGGVMVPLDDTHTVRDWIAAAELPAIIVAGSYLGSLSHTLTALCALQQIGVQVKALVVSESPDSSVILDATVSALARHAMSIPVIPIARVSPDVGVQQLAHFL